MGIKFDDNEVKLTISIMDGDVSDAALSADIICTIDIGIDKILEWLEKNKYKDTIFYKGKEYRGKDQYLNVFIFNERIVLDKFLQAIRITENYLEEGFLIHDISHELSSTVGKIREIKSYDFEDKIKGAGSIEGMVEFIDSTSFGNGTNDIVERERLLIKIDDIDYRFREIFYSKKVMQNCCFLF